MQYIKETRSGHPPYAWEEITRAEAEAQIGATALQDAEDQVRRYNRDFPGIAVMVETGAGAYVGAQE